MVTFLCFSISDISDLAQVVIALANVILVIYVFTYTRNKDNEDISRNLNLQEQNINLQWFKDLIILPNYPFVLKFYEDIMKISEKLMLPGLSDQDKIKISDDIKAEQSKLRKSFVDVLRIADLKLEQSVKTNLDTLIGEITLTVFDRGINLTHPPAFEKEITNKIVYSKNDLISLIYGFKGVGLKS